VREKPHRRRNRMMNTKSVAPCGLLCDLCSGFQRNKNKCNGCNADENKTSHCSACRIKQCAEKKDDQELCLKCKKYPCKIIKNLEKRYATKYGESLMRNFAQIEELGIRAFVKSQNEEWKCPTCGSLLCVHKTTCKHCGAINARHPLNADPAD
jgi:hypothetical protein